MVATRSTKRLAQKLMSSKEPFRSEGLGVSERICRFTWMDLGATAVAVLASFTALTAVLYRPAAFYLGQTNQLIVLGLMLAIMGKCAERQIQRLSLYYEARTGKGTLQNLEAILRTDYFPKTASLQLRLLLLFLFALPLSLSVFYKKSVGGFTTVGIPSTEADFGYTAAPGYQLIGDGLSLLTEVYLPYWIEPSLGRTYGFNLYIVDNTTAAVLDAPLPNDLLKLQASLNDLESITIMAAVNATVTESVDLSLSERNDHNGYWNEKALLFNMSGVNDTTPNPTAFISQAMWAGSNIDKSPGIYNYTEIFLSIWNTEKNQSFYSEAERFITTRRTCVGSAMEIDMTGQSQQIIVNGTSGVRPTFTPSLGEDDWKSREVWDQPLPGASGSWGPSQHFPAFNTRPALVAAMLWARITSDKGPERPSKTNRLAKYSKTAGDVKLAKRTVTLQRSPWLVAILAIRITEEGRDVLRGAALSGKLSEKVSFRFMTQKVDGLEYERLYLDLGSHVESDKLDPKIKYG
ncbi:MAG: hypothetical protein M1833_002815 [Piccolia ochrophora]|nr:MAG: hypothetical protein M1833_002815 [Piccolia ochrophora]